MNKQSFITILFTLLMSMMGAKVSAHDIAVANTDGKTIYYKWINNKTELAVSCCGSNYDSYSNEYTGNVVIPESVVYEGNTYSVTSISSSAFWDCSGLTSVTIPNSVTSISSFGFTGCSGLISIKVENGNQTYDSRNNCNAIIEKSTNTLIVGCKNTIIPNSVTSIGYNAFYFCSGLTSIIIPNSVTSIGNSAFFGCSGLTSITIPNSVTSFGSATFSNCSGLTSVTIPNSVTSIGSAAFQGCSGLTSVTIPNSVTSIGGNAFWDCSGLTSITIPNSVTSICEFAFYNCSGLTSVTIPNSVTSIGQYAFGSCNLSTIISEIEEPFAINENVFSNKNALLIVPEGKMAAYQATEGWNKFNNIKDHDPRKRTINVETAGKLYSLISAEDKYFIEELTLTGVINGSDFAVIRDMAGKRKYIRSYEVNSFDDFDDTDGRLSVLDMSGVKIVSGGVCLDFDGLDDGDSWIYLAQDDVIPTGIFYGCKKLTSISVPSGLKNVGTDAFEGTSWFENQPEGLVYIGNVLYKYKGDMPENYHITIKEGTLGIANSAFYGRSTLSSIDIPESVKYIGIDDITYFDGRCPFYKFLEGLTYSNVFGGCTNLTTINIPNGVTYIGKCAFKNCSGLTSVIIGSGIEDIRDNAFAYCPNLKDVYCFSEKVPSTNAYAFGGSYIENATLHVPKGCSDAYKAMAPWKNFKSMLEMVDAKVKLSKTKAAIEKGKTLTLKATVTPSDLPDKSVTWKSSNTKVATVTSKGKVKGVKAGTATITCISNSTGAKATCKVTVGYVKLDQSEVSVKKGKTVTLKATVYPSSLTDKSVTWESSNTKIATVTSKGKVKGVKAGTATITCTSNATGLKTTCEVTVGYVKLDQTEVTVKKGKTVTLKATVYPSSLEDKSVTWESSNTKVATVSSKGKVKGVKAGLAVITCTSNATGLSTTCIVTVGYVKLDQTEVTVKKGKTVTLTATVYPSSLEDKSVTWESSNTKVATVTSKGKVKGVKAGTVTITCTSNATSLSTTCIVTVTATAGSRSLEGDDDELTEIDDVEASAAIKPFDVYDLSGRKVLHQVTSLDGLSDGIYIVNGKKILKKK